MTFTKGPLAWQKFGNEWCLTGQYGMRPIVLSVNRRKGTLQLRDSERDLLIPFDPNHPDAKYLVMCWNTHQQLLEACHHASFAIPTSHAAFEIVRAAIKAATED